MQFFNDELYANGRSHAAYAAYISSLPSGLPDAILRINRGMLPDPYFADPEQAICLHDARIASIVATDQSLRLALNVDHDDVYSQVVLDYSGVSTLGVIPDVLLQDVADSDLMFHETTVLECGAFNHKMLFASSDILSVNFQSLSVQVSPVES